MVDKSEPGSGFRKFTVGDSTIFDDICELQKLIQIETELKQTFFHRFDKMIQKTLRNQIINFADQQLALHSDLEVFRWTALVEANQENAKLMPRPQRRILVRDPSTEFDSEDAANSVHQLLGFLWEYPEVYDAFSNDFLVPYCLEQMAIDPFKVDEILGLVVHRLLCDLTGDVADYRVVTIQERYIKQVIDRCATPEEVLSHPLLHKFFEQLKATNEARLCLHYLFRIKCERIDTSFFTVKNLLKTYQRYKTAHEQSQSSQDEESKSTASSRSSIDSLVGSYKSEREQLFYREMFIQLLDIVDAITGQMFERISVIPYAIRQFCKCIFQMSIDKFGSQNVTYEKGIRMVAHFLLDEWLLKACFTNLHIEGLTKEFYLGAYCKKNLQLTKDILYNIMTFKEWEVPTPFSERPLKVDQHYRDLFSVEPDKKKKQRQHVDAYYRDLLQLDHKRQAKQVLQIDDLVRMQNKFPWRMMLVSLEDVKVLMEFFKKHVVNIRKGAKVLLERIEDFGGPAIGQPVDFSNIPPVKIVTEQTPQINQDEDLYAGTGIDANELQQHKQSVLVEDHFTSDNIQPRKVNYMLFLKAPTAGDDKKLKEQKAKIMALENPGESQMRTHINLLLHEAEPLARLKMTINDPNSLSEIMSVIRQHTEKKKAFGDQDFINKILQNSIAQFFGRGSRSTQAETRESFQRFIKSFTGDQQKYMAYLQDVMMADIVLLKSQQKTLSDRIKLAVTQDTLVHNLKATKARSRFIQDVNLKVSIYKYEPSNYLELVLEESTEQAFPREFEIYKDFKEKEQKRYEYEQWLENERASKTSRNMAGNLALTFLFKDQDLHEIIKFKQGGANGGQAPAKDAQAASMQSQQLESRRSSKVLNDPNGIAPNGAPKDKLGENLISKEEYDELSARFRKADGREMEPHEVPGYYTRKVRYQFQTLNDFIAKLRKTSVCDKFFKKNDSEFSGLRKLFQKLFEITRKELQKHELLGNEDELDHNMVEISNYVMYNLHSEFFYNAEQSLAEKKFQRKMEVLEKLPSSAFGVQIEDSMRHAWKMAIKEASRLQEQQTPLGKLQQLQKVMKIIEQSYSLYKNEQITADHLATIIPYILVKAKIDRMLSHHNYIQSFHYSVNQGDITSVVLTNLDIAMTRLKSTDFDSHILQADPNFFEKENEYERRDASQAQKEEAREAKQARKLKKANSIENNGMDTGLRKQQRIVKERKTEMNMNRAELEQIIETIHENNEKQ